MKLLALFALLATPTNAAISILVEPGAPGTSVFTVTETAPNPLLDVAGISGFVLGMELPNSMLNISGLNDGFSSDIVGNLISSIATITEIFSGQSYRLSASAAPSLVYFDRIYLTSGGSSARFQASSPGPVVTNIGFEALTPGTHAIASPIFGSVTVTVVPEPTTFAILTGFALSWASRRKRSTRTVDDC